LKTPVIVALAVVGLVSIGFSLNSVDAELTADNVYVLEGAGFAVTENTIKNSQIDFILSTGNIANGRGSITFEDGFVTLDDDDFIAENILGTILRDGRFLRISGNAEDSSGNEVTLRLFGRLIEDSNNGSIYSFTGKLIQGNTEYKIIYTSKLSGFTGSGIIAQTSPSSIEPIAQTSTPYTEPDKKIIRITPGAHDIGFNLDYRTGVGVKSAAVDFQGSDQKLKARYYSVDRITTEPGTTVTFVNDDSESHTIVSGTGGSGSGSRLGQGKLTICAENEQVELPEGFSYIQTGCSFTLDGRINTGEILPGNSVDVTFEDAGFYRLNDPNYPWMRLDVYSFPDIENSLVIKEHGKPKN